MRCVYRAMVGADCDCVGAGYRLIALAKAGWSEGERIVFLHTGGAQDLFSYPGELEPMFDGSRPLSGLR